MCRENLRFSCQGQRAWLGEEQLVRKAARVTLSVAVRKHMAVVRPNGAACR